VTTINLKLTNQKGDVVLMKLIMSKEELDNLKSILENSLTLTTGEQSELPLINVEDKLTITENNEIYEIDITDSAFDDIINLYSAHVNYSAQMYAAIRGLKGFSEMAIYEFSKKWKKKIKLELTSLEKIDISTCLATFSFISMVSKDIFAGHVIKNNFAYYKGYTTSNHTVDIVISKYDTVFMLEVFYAKKSIMHIDLSSLLDFPEDVEDTAIITTLNESDEFVILE
jgi:hypothetical protein